MIHQSFGFLTKHHKAQWTPQATTDCLCTAVRSQRPDSRIWIPFPSKNTCRNRTHAQVLFYMKPFFIRNAHLNIKLQLRQMVPFDFWKIGKRAQHPQYFYGCSEGAVSFRYCWRFLTYWLMSRILWQSDKATNHFNGDGRGLMFQQFSFRFISFFANSIHQLADQGVLFVRVSHTSRHQNDVKRCVNSTTFAAFTACSTSNIRELQTTAAPHLWCHQCTGHMNLLLQYSSVLRFPRDCASRGLWCLTWTFSLFFMILLPLIGLGILWCCTSTRWQYDCTCFY